MMLQTKAKRRTWWLLAGAAVVLAAAGRLGGLQAGEPAPPAAQQPVPAPPSAPDPFIVPEGTAEQLLEYIAGLREQQPQSREPEVVQAFVLKLHRAVAQASGKVLAGKPNDQQAEQAVRYRVVSLSMLDRLGDEQAGKLLEALPGELTNAGREELARQVQSYLLQGRLRDALGAGPEALEPVVKDIKQFVNEGPLGQAELGLIFTLTRVLEMTGKPELAAESYKEFGKRLAESEDAQIARLGEKLQGAARRLLLVGKKMHLEGTFLDGTPLDWDKYRGKVVLVQFWASWCGPCRREIVNIRKHYDLYHERGFEVIGINCDDTREDVEAFLKENPLPWPNLFSADPAQAGMDNPMATYYGVMGIPTLLLVGPDGNVVSLEVRGPMLGKELEKLLGPAEPPPAPEEKPAGTSRAPGVASGEPAA